MLTSYFIGLSVVAYFGSGYFIIIIMCLIVKMVNGGGKYDDDACLI
jgi:hypothetical protein